MNAFPLSDLMARYLERHTAAHEAGLGFADLGDQVTPYDSVLAPPVEPRLAWTGALAVLPLLGSRVDPTSWKAPSDWPMLVATHEPEVALPFALGHYPQLVRSIPTLPIALRVPPRRPQGTPSLLQWAESATIPHVGAAVLRLAGEFEEAERLLHTASGSPETQALHANEEAALLWQRGQHTAALNAWKNQPDHIPVLFNRGMAFLFLGQPEAARPLLDQATAGLDEANPWHHLGCLYRTLAE